MFDQLLLIKNINPSWNAIRLYDSWSKTKCSGFPKNDSEHEFTAYAENNNQYLIKAEKQTKLIIVAR